MIDAILFLIAGAVLVSLVERVSRLFRYIPALATFSSFVLLLAEYPRFSSGAATDIIWKAPPFGILLQADGFSGLLALAFSFCAFLITLHATEFLKNKRHEAQHHALMLLMFAGLLGILLTGDLFNMYVFLEIASISAYALTAYYQNKKAVGASMRYLVLGSLGTSLFLLGITLLYSLTQTLNIADITLSLDTSSPASLLPLALIFTGFGVKAGIVPLHLWKPSVIRAATAPTAAAIAGLSGAVGVYMLSRLLYTIYNPLLNSTSYFVMGFGLLTAIVGTFMAFRETSLKRIFAFSGISQIGYVLVAFSLLTYAGFYAGIFHLVNLILLKVLLFISIGAIILHTGREDIGELSGLASTLHVPAIGFLVGALGTAGIPPFNGFYSKLLIYQAAFSSGHPLIGVLLIVLSALTLAYFLRLFSAIFLGNPLSGSLRRVGPATIFPLFLLVAACIALGLSPSAVSYLTTPAADSILAVQAYTGVLP